MTLTRLTTQITRIDPDFDDEHCSGIHKQEANMDTSNFISGLKPAVRLDQHRGSAQIKNGPEQVCATGYAAIDGLLLQK